MLRRNIEANEYVYERISDPRPSPSSQAHEGLVETPARVLRFYEALYAGYARAPGW